ncbi:MAG: methylmalonyl Co-A mutase-associated GTPase MeaB [Planctomycetota bacterium]
MKILQEFKAGQRRALSQAITWVENRKLGYEKILEEVFSYTGKAHRIGVTGPPGSGKSTLISALTEIYRKENKLVGILCIDPSSSFHGGALLGDRYRMSDHTSDPGVFIRSTANRGMLGGIAESTADICDLLDAFGFHTLFIETVGVGQSEIDIVQIADTILLNLSPESGDSIQGMKSGIMEIANLIFVNKGDRPEASKLVYELDSLFTLTQRNLPILKGSALTKEGLPELYEQLKTHCHHLLETKQIHENQQKRLAQQLRKKVEFYVLTQLHQPEFSEKIEKLAHSLLENRQEYSKKLTQLFQSIEIHFHP